MNENLADIAAKQHAQTGMRVHAHDFDYYLCLDLPYSIPILINPLLQRQGLHFASESVTPLIPNSLLNYT